jgi:hypothetical protein
MGLEKLRVGQRVRFLDDVGEGTVTAILSSTEAMVEDDSGFEVPHPIASLVALVNQDEAQSYQRHLPSVSAILQQEVDPQKQRALERSFKTRYEQAASSWGSSSAVEVDLHAHELVDTTSGLDAATILELQLAHFERMLRVAIEQRTPRIVFIHGVGQGVLKHEIWQRVDRYYPECTCRYADPHRFGSGATEITISSSRGGQR